MANQKYWLTSGFYTMMHRGIDFFLGFVGFMLLVRIISPGEFGVWVLLITITAIVEMARNGFLQNGMIKFLIGRNIKTQSKIQASALLQNALLTLIFMVMIWISADWIERILHADGLASILKIHTYVLPVLVIHTHNLVLMQAKYDFKAYFLAGISKSMPFFLMVLYFYIDNRSTSLETLTWLQNLAWILATMMSCYQVRRHFRVRGGWHRYWNKKIFHFGKYVFGTNLISMLTNSLDKFLLGALLSPVQVAMANAAGRVMNMVEIPVNSIASISYPKAAASFDKKHFREVGETYEKTLGMMLSMTVPFWIFNLVFAHYIVLIIAGEEYLDAVPFLRIVAFTALVKPFDRQSGVFLDAVGKPFVNMLMVTGTFMYGAVLSWLFIQSFGLMGAAYGIVTATMITAAIKQIILNRYIPIRLDRAFRHARDNYPRLWKTFIAALKKAD
ncbi:oligosaccharide flippase family protein [Negadavirga shengliensis]|uniref:Oligosaccharide flippase family protein n=1 Tax=Negadavirga shengliensis TaxID=1389218 RepID=A0ABV9T4B3_9BACT